MGAKRNAAALSLVPLTDSPAAVVCRRRRPPTAVLAPLDPTAPPDFLPEAARTHWRELGTELADAGSLAALDADAFAIYCTLFARWTGAEAKVVELGTVVKGPAGVPMQNPYLSVAAAALRQLTVLARELGLTPAARGELRKG